MSVLYSQMSVLYSQMSVLYSQMSVLYSQALHPTCSEDGHRGVFNRKKLNPLRHVQNEKISISDTLIMRI